MAQSRPPWCHSRNWPASKLSGRCHCGSAMPSGCAVHTHATCRSNATSPASRSERKCTWLPWPTGPPTHGQSWSMPRMSPPPMGE
eukprot:scaffold123_cov54-Phaeocystis_antarctica.AAC.2